MNPTESSLATMAATMLLLWIGLDIMAALVATTGYALTLRTAYLL